MLLPPPEACSAVPPEPATATPVPAAPATAAPAPEAPAPAPGRGPRLRALDGLRLLAALGVMLFHYTGKDLDPRIWGARPRALMPEVSRISSYTWLGVELFFLISGFVICMSCWGKRPRDFLTSRVVRLYPAYWFAVLLTAAVVALAARPWGSYHELTYRLVLTNLTMFQWPMGTEAVDPIYWTLWIEMRFYVVFAVVLAFGLTYRRVVLFCMAWTLAAILAPGMHWGPLTELAQPQYAPFFVAGIVMYLMHRFGPNPLLWGMLGFSWLFAQNQMPGIIRQYEAEVRHPIPWTNATLVMTAGFLLVLAAALGRWTG
ncbi:acyltransferase family protein [Kitasatospora arboriphila]